MAFCQKLFSPAVAGILALLHVSGVGLLPLPCVVTLCVMQTFAVLNGLIERPQKSVAKGGLERAQVLDTLAVLTQSACSLGAEVMAQHATNARRAVALVLVCVLARSLRVAGFFGSLLQVIGIACLCGGVACLAYLAVTWDAQRQDKPVCDCWCRHKDSCRAGKTCPYHPKFWPEMPCLSEQDVVEVDDAQEEDSFVANLMVSHDGEKQDLSRSILSEEASMDLLADMEYRSLLADLPGIDVSC